METHVFSKETLEMITPLKKDKEFEDKYKKFMLKIRYSSTLGSTIKINASALRNYDPEAIEERN